jgi:hypothetical protein
MKRTGASGTTFFTDQVTGLATSMYDDCAPSFTYTSAEDDYSKVNVPVTPPVASWRTADIPPAHPQAGLHMHEA